MNLLLGTMSKHYHQEQQLEAGNQLNITEILGEGQKVLQANGIQAEKILKEALEVNEVIVCHQ